MCSHIFSLLPLPFLLGVNAAIPHNQPLPTIPALYIPFINAPLHASLDVNISSCPQRKIHQTRSLHFIPQHSHLKMGKGENSPLLKHGHSHDHGHSHSHGDKKQKTPKSATKPGDCTNHHYMTIDVHDPNASTHNFSILRADCDHSHSSVLEPQFYSTYQQDCELETDADKLQSYLESSSYNDASLDKQVSWVINVSLCVNIFLFVFKVWAWNISHSLSIAASTVDSFLDLCVQLVIYISHGERRKDNAEERRRYPVGKSRLEPVGLVICAALMFIAGLQLVTQSTLSLWNGGDAETNIDLSSVAVIGLVIFLKSALWYYCYAQRESSDTIETLAFDHLNDVLSNIVAMISIALVAVSAKLWFTDPVGCIIISIYIARNWYELAMEKIHELVGVTADEAFVDKLTNFVNHYHPEQMELDTIRAYHFGQKYLVEVDIVLPAEMSVREAHDICVKLQQTIERMEQVERCFVHPDYTKRTIDEHDARAIAESRLQQIRQQSPVAE